MLKIAVESFLKGRFSRVNAALLDGITTIISNHAVLGQEPDLAQRVNQHFQLHTEQTCGELESLAATIAMRQRHTSRLEADIETLQASLEVSN